MTVVTIRVLRDAVEPNTGDTPVAPGAIVRNAYLPPASDVFIQPGEAWYEHPITGEDWLSLPGDFEIYLEEARID